MKIRIETFVKLAVEKVYEFWTDPLHIVGWNQASKDWHTVRAENDLKAGGRFTYRMEATDGSACFDFKGVHQEVVSNSIIRSILLDGRTMEVVFNQEAEGTRVVEEFETEDENPVELQRIGWQAILDSFRDYAERQGL